MYVRACVRTCLQEQEQMRAFLLSHGFLLLDDVMPGNGTEGIAAELICPVVTSGVNVDVM